MSDIDKKNLFSKENMGLYTSKLLLDQIGGSLTVESKLKFGTSFTLNFSAVSQVISQDIGENLLDQCKQVLVFHPFEPEFLKWKSDSHVFMVKQNKADKINTSLPINLDKILNIVDKHEKEIIENLQIIQNNVDNQ